MRKLYAILCSCCLLFMVGGHQLLFCWQQAAIKDEVKQALKSQQSSTVSRLSLSQEEYKKLVWEDEDHKEFTYKGKLHDLVSEQKTNGGYLLSCFVDEKETSLVNRFLSITHGANENSTLIGLLKVLWQQFIPSRPAEIIQTVCSHQQFILSPSALLIQRPISIITPPPDYC